MLRSRDCRRSVGVEREPGGRLGPHGSLAVVPGDRLDVDAPAPSIGVRVLDLGVWIEHASLGLDGEAQFLGDAVSLSVGGPFSVLPPHGLASARDGALELGAEPDPPDGGALRFEALPLLPAGAIECGVVRGL